MTTGDSSIQPAKQVRNLGVTFDQQRTMKAHIARSAAQSMASCVLSVLSGKYLTEESTACLVHCLIMARLHYANALLCSVHRDQTPCLQKVQN